MFFRGSLLLPLALPALACADLPTLPFDPAQVRGAYLAEVEIVGRACPDGAPRLVAEEIPITIELTESNLAIEGFPAPLAGPIDTGGHFTVAGGHASPLGRVESSMEGDFLRSSDGRGFVALLVERAPGCRQEFRVRAY